MVRACNEAGVPFLARGAGTGLSGGATPVDGCVLIECSRMDRVLSIDATNRTAPVQPGLINAQLSRGRGRASACTTRPIPRARARARSAATSPRTAAARTRSSTAPPARTCSSSRWCCPTPAWCGWAGATGSRVGYDLRAAFVGSEGTLGIATAITVRLLPLPEKVETLLASFADLPSACQAVSDVIAARHRARGARADRRPHHRGGRGVGVRGRLPARARAPCC